VVSTAPGGTPSTIRCDRGREYISGAFLDFPKPGLLKDRNQAVRLRQGVPQSVTPVSPRVSGSA